MTYPLTIAGGCRELLDETSEPLPLSDLVAHTIALGRTQARYPEMSVASTLRTNPHVLPLPGDRFLSVRRLLEGRLLTTPSPDELDPWAPSPQGFDLAPFASLPDPPPEHSDRTLLAYRCRGGALVAERVDRSTLADPAELVEFVRPQLDHVQLWRRDVGREVLLACSENDALLRNPTAPLSELFPDLAPEPIEPPQHSCPACDGTGQLSPERDWSTPYDAEVERSFAPRGWQDRIERLEDVVFGS